MTDKMGNEVKENDIIEVIFYNYWEPICGVFYQMINGELKYLKGDIPKEYFTTEISAMRYSKDFRRIGNGVKGK